MVIWIILQLRGNIKEDIKVRDEEIRCFKIFTILLENLLIQIFGHFKVTVTKKSLSSVSI